MELTKLTFFKRIQSLKKKLLHLPLTIMLCVLLSHYLSLAAYYLAY